MAKFPIKHAEKGPPGFGPSVRANLDVRTGEPEIWEQMARAGGRLAEVASKLRQAEDVVGNAEVKLKMDEETNAYISAYQTTGDKEALAKLTEQYKTNLQQLVTNDETKVYSLGRMSQSATWTAKHEIERRIKDNEIRGGRILQSYLETGDEDAYKAFVAERVSDKMLLPEEGVGLIQNFPVNSALAQVDNLVASDDPANWLAAENMLNGLPVDSMTEEQLADRRRWRSAVAQKQKAADYAQVVNIIETMDEMRGKPQAELIETGKEMKADVFGLGRAGVLSPEKVDLFIGRINDWMEGKDVTTDYVTYDDIFTEARHLHINSTPDDVARINGDVLEAFSAGKLTVADAKYLRNLVENRFEEAQTYDVNYGVKMGERMGVDPDVLHRAIITGLQTGTIKPTEIVKRSAEIAAELPKIPPEGTFARKWIEQTIGVLESNRYTDAGDALDYVLSRLGPDWAMVSPRAAEVFKRRWPLSSWHYRTDEEKASLLERARNAKSAFWDGTIVDADITEGDREWAVEIAPSGPITPEQVKKFEDYLDETGTIFPKPPEPSAAAPEAVPPPEQREIGKSYLLPNGKMGVWNGTVWEVAE